MHIILWFLLIALLAFCAWRHSRENRVIVAQWRKDLDHASARWISGFVWSRTWQMLSALAACVAMIIVYDWQLARAYREIAELEGAVENSAAAIGDLNAQMEMQKQTLEKARQAADTQTQLDMPAKPVKLETSAAASLESIYNPETNENTKTSRLDAIKKRYEDILVTYMFLKKCGQTIPVDYHVITSALGQEMASINAPGRLQYDILTAARGSYKEMYSKTSCNDRSVGEVSRQYRTYIESLSRDFASDVSGVHSRP